MHIYIVILAFEIKNSYYGCLALSLTFLYNSFSSFDACKSFSSFLIRSFNFSFSTAASLSLLAKIKHCEILLLDVVGMSFIIPNNSESLIEVKYK